MLLCNYFCIVPNWRTGGLLSCSMHWLLKFSMNLVTCATSFNVSLKICSFKVCSGLVLVTDIQHCRADTPWIAAIVCRYWVKRAIINLDAFYALKFHFYYSFTLKFEVHSVVVCYILTSLCIFIKLYWFRLLNVFVLWQYTLEDWLHLLLILYRFSVSQARTCVSIFSIEK